MTINLKLTGRLQLLDNGINIVDHELAYDITNAIDMKNRTRVELAVNDSSEITLDAQASAVLVTSDEPIRIATDTNILGRSTNFVADVSNDTLTLNESVKWYTGKEVQVSTTDTLPTGLSAFTTYYVISKGESKIQLATNLINAEAGTNIDITGVGSGIHSIVGNESEYATNINETTLSTIFLLTGCNVRKLYITNPSTGVAEVRISAYK